VSRTIAAAVVVVVVAAGCGSAPEGYAGLSRTGALKQATGAVASTTNDRADPLYGHRLRLIVLTRGRDLAGDKAWLARYEDLTTGTSLCVWVSARILSRKTSLRTCGPAPRPTPPPSAPSPTPPALS
jgi:hypothetical protein